MQTITLNDLVSSIPTGERAAAEALFERVFESLNWIQTSGKTIEEISPLKQWVHRQTSEIEADMVYLHIDRVKVLAALSEYLSAPELRSKQADWLFLNVLVYAEYIATVSELRLKILGLERYTNSLNPQKKEHSSDIASMAIRPWHVPIALLCMAIGWTIHPIVGVGGTAYALYYAHRKQQVSKTINTTISSMLQTYLSLNTIDLGWNSVSANLKRSSDVGAIWDASLYALVESRLRTSPT